MNSRVPLNTDNPSLPSVPGTGGNSGSVSWNQVTGKPDVYPPQAHTHPIAQVDGLTAALNGKVANDDPRLSDARTPLPHTHPISGVTGLQAALDAKASATSVSEEAAARVATDSNLQAQINTKASGDALTAEIVMRRNKIADDDTATTLLAAFEAGYAG